MMFNDNLNLTTETGIFELWFIINHEMKEINKYLWHMYEVPWKMEKEILTTVHMCEEIEKTT